MANGSQFSIDVVAALNTDNVPKQLDELNARLTKTTSNVVKIPVGIDENGKRVFGEFLKDVRTYKDELNNLYKRQTITDPFSGMVKSDSLKKITDSVKTLTTETHKWTNSKGEINEWATTVDSAGQVVSKRTKQYVDETNNLVKETTSWTRNSQGQWEQVGDTIRNISDNVKNATTVLSTETHKWTSTNGDINKWVTTVDDAGNVVSNRTKQYKNDIGELVTETSKWTKNSQGQWQQVGETIKTVTDDFKQSTNIISTETHKFVDSQGAVQTWVTTIDDAGKRVSTRTKEIVDGMGNVTQVTQRFEAEAGKPFKKVGDDIVKVSEILQETTTTTSTTVGQITDTINGVERTFEGTITTIKKVSSNGEELTTVISKYTNDMGQAVERTEQFNKAGDKVATTMRKISEATPAKNTETKTWIDKNGVKTVEQYLNGVLQLTTKTREYINENKELVKETTQLEGAEKRLISTHTERSRNIQKETEELNKEIDATFRLRNALISTTTTTSKGKTTQFGDTSGKEYDALITKIERVDAANKKVIETTWEFTNAQGQLVRQTRITDTEGKKLAEDTIQISDAQEKASNSTQKYNTATQQATKSTRTFGQALTDALGRLVRYYIASLPIQAVRKAISETITTIKEFDSALVEFRKVSDLAGESLTRYVAKLAEMGEITGSTMQAMVEASTEFKKSGFSEEDSAKLASIAEKYRNIADEEIDAGEAASFIIAQMKAFNIEADQAEHIIDAVNEVANNFAVSSADLAKNLGNMSAIMAINNVSMEEQIGMLTGVTEITRKAATASRGLVMISSRLTQVLDDTSSTGKKLTKIYNDLGIELKDENGQLRSHYDILGDLAEKWDSLSENQQKYIALTSAGARQQQNFVALMSNWGNVAEATTKAYNSLGSAQRENEKVMDSVAKKVEILKSQFQKLVIGKGGLQDFAKGILNIGIALLKFANSDAGKAIITIVALTTALYGLRRAINALNIVSMVTGLMNVARYAVGATTATQAFGYAVAQLTKRFAENAIAWATTPMGAATIAIAAIVGLTYAAVKFNNAIFEATERTKELSDASKETETEIETLNNELQNISEALDELNDKRLELTDANELNKLQDKTKELKKQEASLKRQLELQIALLEKQHEDESNAAKKALKKTQTSEFSPSHRAHFIGVKLGTNVTAAEELEIATNKYKELETQVNSLIGVLEQEEKAGRKEGDLYKDTSEELEKLIEQQEKAKSRGIEMAEVVQTNTDSLYGQDEETQKLKDENYKLLDAFYEVIGVSQQVEEQISETTLSEEELEEQAAELEESLKSAAEAIGLTATELEGLRNIFQDDEKLNVFLSQLAAIKQEISDTSTVIDNLQESLETASSALDEYNEKGYLTLDTFQALMGISAQYLAALVNEEGQLEINQTTLGNLVEQLKIAKIQELAQAAAMEIAANHTEYAGKASANAVGSVAAIGNTIQTVGNQAATAAGQVASFGQTVSAFSDISFSQMTAEDKKILNYYKDIAKSLSEIEVNTTKAGNAASKAGKKAAGGAKEAKDATKELNKELEETKSKYDKVITFITGRIDKQIKAIQKAKDEELKAIEATIKAREKEKDKALDAIEQQINALEKEKKAREKYWDDQIDALKKTNDERKDALELQEKLDALERAKNTKVKVYKEGQGFVYDVDQTAVAEAQKALDEYLSEKAYEDELERLNALKDAEINNYDKRLEALNEYKDKVQESYEKQIEALNAHKEALEEQYDAQIEYYQNFKEQFEEMVKAYEDKQTELLASQLTGINFENNNWMTRLDNLAKFVSEYNRLQEQLNTGNTNVTNTASMSGGGGDGLSKGTSKTTTNTTPTINGNNLTPAQREQLSRQGNKVVVDTGNAEYRARVLHIKTGHADGISSVKDNEIAVVGENPNKEIVVGSKLNNGQLMSLDKGTGVVNAKSSNTLAGLLNQVGQFGSSGFGSGNGTLNSNINNDSLTINGVTIQGANINDPQTFVNGLLNLKAEALQRAYRHR